MSINVHLELGDIVLLGNRTTNCLQSSMKALVTSNSLAFSFANRIKGVREGEIFEHGQNFKNRAHRLNNRSPKESKQLTRSSCMLGP